MKQRNKILTKSTSGLIVAVLAIMAFVRGPLQIWLLGVAFTVWAVTATASVIAWNRKRQQYARRPVTVKRDENGESTFKIPDLDAPGDPVLLRHVNHRISSYLKSVYPEITWEWITADPMKEVLNAGEGRIRLFGAQEFNEAAVIFDTGAKSNCCYRTVNRYCSLWSIVIEYSKNIYHTGEVQRHGDKTYHTAVNGYTD